MADGAQANHKGFRKKVLVRHPSGCGTSCFRASSAWRTCRSGLALKKFFIIAILASSILPMTQGGLLNLQAMVEALTGRNAIRDFVGYGCYCGPGGRGLPMDEVDWCCHAHDCCYQKLFDLGCHPYVDRYEYTIENNTVFCSELNKTECDKQTCECDKDVTLCLMTHKYNEKYRGYLNIRCRGTMPDCNIYEPLPKEVACGYTAPTPPTRS
ncbi:PREDICTED: group IIF secretory phospholipase A2 [Elephantulus edwardii]|uniref:group IIF secretory phospholipase A2 n=1 Tax=Elephantulus edwardii TaxID=28737 RepID=UPI0003F07838|nr:PREDICTED: group IIF secretory phospholipase A2 [Elephantulus edwardii]